MLKTKNPKQQNLCVDCNEKTFASEAELRFTKVGILQHGNVLQLGAALVMEVRKFLGGQ